MRVACAAPAPTTGGPVLELNTKSQDEGKNPFNKRLAIYHQAE